MVNSKYTYNDAVSARCYGYHDVERCPTVERFAVAEMTFNFKVIQGHSLEITLFDRDYRLNFAFIWLRLMRLSNLTGRKLRIF